MFVACINSVNRSFPPFSIHRILFVGRWWNVSFVSSCLSLPCLWVSKKHAISSSFHYIHKCTLHVMVQIQKWLKYSLHTSSIIIYEVMHTSCIVYNVLTSLISHWFLTNFVQLTIADSIWFVALTKVASPHTIKKKERRKRNYYQDISLSLHSSLFEHYYISNCRYCMELV